MGQAHLRAEDLRGLRRTSRHPSGSSVDTARLVMSVLAWVRTAVACEAASVQVLLPDESGRLRPFAAEGPTVIGGRLRSSRRRQVFASAVPLCLPLRDPAGHSLALYPLAADGETFGVVEIAAPSRNLQERSETLSSVIDQSATLVRSVIEGEGSATMLRLATDLLRADTQVAAIRGAVRLGFEHIGSPIVGLLPDRAGSGWFVAAATGIGAKRRAELLQSTRDVSAVGTGQATRDDLAARFAAVIGCEHAMAIDAGACVLLAVADLGSPHRVFLDTAGSLLSEALQRLGEVGWAQTRNENLDLGLAWTAHELQAPLVGATAALGHVLIDDPGPEDRDLLRQTRDELQRLSELIDPLLRWSAGPSPLRIRKVDLVRIVRDVETSCRLEFEEAQLIVEAPDHLELRGDAQQLRGAIGNVVRNALAYSPPATQVKVVVGSDSDVACVSVRDRGPGVPVAERHLIFDPFARGRIGLDGRGGKGLGLFMARRIVEAHEGTIALRTVRPGAEFCIELPLAGTGRPSSAS